MISYFISDLHLSALDQPNYLLFKKFMVEQAPAADQLYILGDFFDYWIGDDVHSALINQVKQDLRDLVDKNVKVYLMVGNRDFYMGKRFARDAKVELIADPTPITIGEQRVLLTHGDLLCRDPNYHIYRVFIRSSFSHWVYHHLFPMSLRVAIANFLRKRSTKTNKKKKQLQPRTLTADKAYILDYLKRFESTVMVHGHFHKPIQQQLQLKGRVVERFVLSDWHEQATILEANVDQIGLLEIRL